MSRAKRLDYAAAAALVDRTRNGGKRIGNNTWAERTGPDEVGIRLHSTYVVRIRSDGSYVLSSGGWRTVTTKDRINDHAPGRVVQESGEWYLWRPGRASVRFYDGMVVDGAGDVVERAEVVA